MRMVIMPKRRNRFSDYITAFGANLMSGSGIGTCRSLVYDPVAIGMSLRADGSAFKQCSASCASSLFQAVMSTVCLSYDIPFSFIVSERRNLMIGRIATSRTGVVGIMASFGAGRSFSIMMYKIMAQCIKRFGDNVTTMRADLMSFTGFGTCRILIYNPISIGMASCRNLMVGGISAS